MSAEHGQQQQSGGRRGRSSGDKKSKKRSRRKETYSMYIYKVLKQVRVGSWRARACVCRVRPDRVVLRFPLALRGGASGTPCPL